jgi:hypothetical protein
MTKRYVEVFTAGCPMCDEVVNLVHSMRARVVRCRCTICGKAAVRTNVATKPDGTGLQRFQRSPSMACCRRATITASSLREAGIRQA